MVGFKGGMLNLGGNDDRSTNPPIVCGAGANLEQYAHLKPFGALE